jgi:threonine synthase
MTAKAAHNKIRDIYYASHVMNPFFLQGTKTFAYEICEQLHWIQPEVVFIPVGNGTLFLGAHMGFKDLIENGIIDDMPRLIAVQAENCSPLYHRIHPGMTPPESNHKTIAEGIAIRSPIREAQIIEAVNQSKGEIIVVTEHEIMDSMNELNRKGFYVEPSSAVAAAGFTRYSTKLNPRTVSVVALTGHGLKGSGEI